MVRPPRTKIRAQGTLAPPPPPFLAAAHVSQVSLPALFPREGSPRLPSRIRIATSGGGSAPSERPRALLALVACWWLCMCVMFLLVVLGDVTRMLLRCCCALPRAVILQFQFGTRGSRGRFRKLPARGETGNSPDPRVWIRLATLATLGVTLCFPGSTLGRPCNDPAATLEHPPEAGAIWGISCPCPMWRSPTAGRLGKSRERVLGILISAVVPKPPNSQLASLLFPLPPIQLSTLGGRRLSFCRSCH